MTWEEIAQYGGSKLAGIAVEQGVVYVASSGSGEIMYVPSEDEEERDLQRHSFTGGVPSALAFDDDGALFVADFAFKCILSKPADQESEWVPVVADYEGRQFFGPNSLCFATNGTLFFTDSGPMGDTSLASPKGSVFCVSREDRLLKPLALECLAHPSGIVAKGDGSVVYVSETMANRVLRLVRRSNDVYHCSVYHTFDGGLGPTALAIDSRNRLFVARYDFAELGSTSSVKGGICILDEEGNVAAPERSSGTIFQGKNAGATHLLRVAVPACIVHFYEDHAAPRDLVKLDVSALAQRILGALLPIPLCGGKM